MTVRCTEIEQLDQQHDLFNLHKKLRETAGLYKRRTCNIITDNDGTVLWDLDDRIAGWRENMETLFGEEH